MPCFSAIPHGDPMQHFPQFSHAFIGHAIRLLNSFCRFLAPHFHDNPFDGPENIAVTALYFGSRYIDEPEVRLRI